MGVGTRRGAGAPSATLVPTSRLSLCPSYWGTQGTSAAAGSDAGPGRQPALQQRCLHLSGLMPTFGKLQDCQHQPVSKEPF